MNQWKQWLGLTTLCFDWMRYINNSMMKMPSWCENGAKKCHTLAKSFSSYEFETRFFCWLLSGSKTIWKITPAENWIRPMTHFFPAVCVKKVLTVTTRVVLWSWHTYTQLNQGSWEHLSKLSCKPQKLKRNPRKLHNNGKYISSSGHYLKNKGSNRGSS